MARDLKPGGIEEADIVDIAHDGRGIARSGGKAMFIEGALPGERVRFRVLKRRRQWDEAGLVEVLSASPDRVVPRCAHFGVCGGCSLQHLAPDAQLAAKERQLLDNLQRIGGVRPGRVFDSAARTGLGLSAPRPARRQVRAQEGPGARRLSRTGQALRRGPSTAAKYCSKDSPPCRRIWRSSWKRSVCARSCRRSNWPPATKRRRWCFESWKRRARTTCRSSSALARASVCRSTCKAAVWRRSDPSLQRARR